MPSVDPRFINPMLFRTEILGSLVIIVPIKGRGFVSGVWVIIDMVILSVHWNLHGFVISFSAADLNFVCSFLPKSWIPCRLFHRLFRSRNYFVPKGWRYLLLGMLGAIHDVRFSQRFDIA